MKVGMIKNIKSVQNPRPAPDFVFKEALCFCLLS